MSEEKKNNLTPPEEREALIEKIVSDIEPKDNTDPEASAREEEAEIVIDADSGEEEVEAKEEEEAKLKEESETEEEEPRPDLTEQIIVDGQKMEVPVSEIIDAGKRTLQKESAADKRLEEATRLLREAQEKTPLPEEKKDEEKSSVEDAKPEKIKELTEAIQYGDEEEAAAAIEEILQIAQSQAISPEAIKNEIREELRIEQINEKLQAPPEEGGFGDLCEDPNLVAIANHAIENAMATGQPYTWKLCKKACQEVRDWVKSFQPEQKDELAERRERKKAAVNEAKSANLKNNQNKKPEEQTASEIIAEMRKVRGQA